MTFTRLIPITLITLIALAGCGGTSSQPTDPTAEYIGRVNGERTDAKCEKTARNLVRDHGGAYVKNFEAAEFFELRLTVDEATAIKDDDRIQDLEPIDKSCPFDGRLVDGSSMTRAETEAVAEQVCTDHHVTFLASFFSGYFVFQGTPDQAAEVAEDVRLLAVDFDPQGSSN